MQFLSSRLMSWPVAIGALILSSVVVAATHVLLVRTDVVEARTLELLPLLLLLLSGLILLMRVVVRRAR